MIPFEMVILGIFGVIGGYSVTMIILTKLSKRFASIPNPEYDW